MKTIVVRIELFNFAAKSNAGYFGVVMFMGKN